MKKILLTTAALAAFSTSAFAEMGMGKDSFYLRADVIGSKVSKTDDYKSKMNNFGMDVGAGYKVMDNMRAEIVYNHLFNPKLKVTSKFATSKLKFTAHALMVRGFVDFADLGMAKLYAGAGLGWAQTGAKATVEFINGATGSVKAKKKNNLAWSLHAGSGFAVADGVTLDVGYSYRDYGKTKGFVDAKTGPKVALRSHNLSAGVRFDI
jgi:opacity protein-like surface antigen